MAAKFGGVEIQLKDVRLSFVHLFEPDEEVSEKTGATSYSYKATLLIPKKLTDGTDNPQVEVIRNAMREVLAKTWPGGEKKIPADRRCFRDGEPKDEETGKASPLYDGYEGQMFLVAKRKVKTQAAKNPVQLLGPRKTAKDSKGNPCFPTLTEADDMLYAGAFANVLVRVYGYDGTKDGNPDRINCSLEAVQFKRHGDKFGAKPVDAQGTFDEEDSDEGDLFEGGGSSKPAAADDDL